MKYENLPLSLDNPDVETREKMAISEKELRTFCDLKVVQELTVIEAVGDQMGFELHVLLANQERSREVITDKNKIRRWKELKTLHRFIKTVCPRVPEYTVVLRKDE